MCLCECVKEREMPVRRELTDINPDRIFLFVHVKTLLQFGPNTPPCGLSLPNIVPLMSSFLPAFLPSFSSFTTISLPQLSAPSHLSSSFLVLFHPAFSVFHLSSLYLFNLLGLSVSLCLTCSFFSPSVSPLFLPIFFYMVVQEIILRQQEIDQIVPNTVFPFSPCVTGFGLPGMQ